MKDNIQSNSVKKLHPYYNIATKKKEEEYLLSVADHNY